MRIGIVINKAWNIYNFRLGLVREFISQGHEVVAIAPKDEYAEELLREGCEFIHVKMENKGTNPLSDLKLIKRLYAAYKFSKIDAVLHYTVKPNIYGTIAAKMLGIKVINNITGLGTIFLRPDKISSKVAIKLYKFAFRFPDKVFFQNKDDRKLFIDSEIVQPSITGLLPGSGVDLDKFDYLGFNRNPQFTFLMVARLLYDKGIIEYIDAIKALRARGVDAKFQILGKIETDAGLGVNEATVKEWIDEGLIEYLGVVKDVRSYVSKADCVVLPSYREGTPRTLLEAGSLGKPLVATDVAGCRETIINGFNGFLCEAKNADDLADKLERMAQLSHEQLKKFGKNSRLLMEQKFDEEIVIEKYFEALHLKREQKMLERTLIRA